MSIEREENEGILEKECSQFDEIWEASEIYQKQIDGREVDVRQICDIDEKGEKISQIALVHHNTSLAGDSDYNARLIQSAPRLLRSLEHVLDSLCYWLPKYGDKKIVDSAMIDNAKELIHFCKKGRI